ncbi:MAG: hypothetical protein HW407_1767 [Bacteroidetes bacterium]|nr:hypothetical protein [Bacteroidota bacterium]
MQKQKFGAKKQTLLTGQGFAFGIASTKLGQLHGECLVDGKRQVGRGCVFHPLDDLPYCVLIYIEESANGRCVITGCFFHKFCPFYSYSASVSPSTVVQTTNLASCASISDWISDFRYAFAS